MDPMFIDIMQVKAFLGAAFTLAYYWDMANGRA
jgi:hypothetical protein